MKLKTIEVNGRTYAEITDGKPIYVQDDGKETPFDGALTASTIARLNAEAKSHREAKEAALAKLAAFDGIDDAAAAVKALKTVANLDAKKLIDAGEAERVKADAIKATEEKYKPVVAERDRLNRAFTEEKLGGGFARSKFIAEKVVVPVEMMQATFGHHFKIENGNVVGYDVSGNKIYSRQTQKAGQLAEIDEALEIIVEATPFRDSILKGNAALGSGAPGSGTYGTGKSVTRAAFDAMPPSRESSFVTTGGTITD